MSLAFVMGEIPEIPDEVKVEVAWKYIEAYEKITGEEFVPESFDVKKEEESIKKALS